MHIRNHTPSRHERERGARAKRRSPSRTLASTKSVYERARVLFIRSRAVLGLVRRERAHERTIFRLARAEFPSRLVSRCLLSLTADRFHVLFNPLFRVLFDFPSRYLSAIGLVGRCLALDGVYHPRISREREIPSLDCTLKQSDSIEDDALPTRVCAERCRHGGDGPKPSPCTTGLPPSMGTREEPRSRGLGVGIPSIERRTKGAVLFLATLHLHRARTRTRGKTRPRRLLGACDASASDLRLAFTRSYSQDPGWFLFLRLLICLSSAGVRV
jgi:hypothetical protein